MPWSRAAPTPDERALVIGAGPIGLGIAASLRARGVEPMVADLNPERLAFAAAWAGLRTLVVDPAEEPTRAVRQGWDGDLPTLVIDATGNAGSMTRTFSLAAHGGRLDLRGTVPGRCDLP